MQEIRNAVLAEHHIKELHIGDTRKGSMVKGFGEFQLGMVGNVGFSQHKFWTVGELINSQIFDVVRCKLSTVVMEPDRLSLNLYFW